MAFSRCQRVGAMHRIAFLIGAGTFCKTAAVTMAFWMPQMVATAFRWAGRMELCSVGAQRNAAIQIGHTGI